MPPEIGGANVYDSTRPVISVVEFDESCKVGQEEFEDLKRQFSCGLLRVPLDCATQPPPISSEGIIAFCGPPNEHQMAYLHRFLRIQSSPWSIAVIENPGNGDVEQFLAVGFDIALVAPLRKNELTVAVSRFREREFLSGLEEVKLGLTRVLGSDQFIGESPEFQTIIERVRTISKSDAYVLISGESGTGKESAARGIHYLSDRRNKPFVPLNCGSVPDNLFENELFGHERGAYTDSGGSRAGLVLEAEGGTLFLDEVDSLTQPAQVKLLRFLEDKKYKPLGSSKYIQASVRVICATNRDLGSAVNEGCFREDLYYRVRILTLDLPPLRQRRDDVLLLAQHFLDHCSGKHNGGGKFFSDEVLSLFRRYPWPGNVRELKNVVEKAVVMSRFKIIRAGDVDLLFDNALGAVDAPIKGFKESKDEAVIVFEREYLEKVLNLTSGNITAAARFAHKDRRAFQRLLKKHGLDRVRQMID